MSLDKVRIMWISLGMAVFLLVSSGWGNAKSELDALTGGIHTRVAWREGGEQISGGSDVVKGFDSKTGEITTIWSGESCVKPVMCSGGNRVLITTSSHKVYVVDWDGTNKTLVVESGMCSDAWVDPATGEEWCVYRPGGTSTGGGVTRCLISDPSTTVRIWDGGEGHKVYPWFQMSADGKQGASFLPYDNAGVIDLETGEATMVSSGCWASHTSDNSYIWFHMQGNHESITVFKGTEKIGSVNLMPPIEPSGQMYCERAAEGPEKGGQFFSVSGGYPGYNKNGNTVEVFVGKFNSDFTSVEGWARITNNDEPDHHSSAWVGVGGSTSPSIKINSDMTGKEFKVGDAVNLKWESQEVASVMILANVNNGGWRPLPEITSGITPEMDSWQDYIWTVPESLNGQPLAGKSLSLMVADYWDIDIADSTASFTVVQGSDIMFPSISRKAWSVFPDERGGLRLYINKSGNYRVRIFKTDGTVIHEFNCAGGGWRKFKINHGPGIFLIQIGSDKNNVRRLFVIQ